MALINNLELKDAINNQLEMEKEVFTNEELLTITEIYLDAVNYSNEYQPIDFNELLLLKNLQKITLRNVYFDTLTLSKLITFANIKELHFIDCTFATIAALVKFDLEVLTFSSCSIDDMKVINLWPHLIELNLEGFEQVDLADIKIINQLKIISLYSSNITNFTLLKQATNLEELRIDNTNIKDFSDLVYLPKLKQVIISRYQIQNNEATINELQAKGISVIDEMNQEVGELNG